MAKGTKRGHQRAEIRRTQNEEQSQAAFAQRRLELFKMANELCTLTGAQVALILFSPNNKVFSFGCPDVQTVFDRYENQGGHHHASDVYHHELEQSNQANQDRLARQLAFLEEKLKSEKKRGNMLDQMLEERKGKYWWDCPIENLELNQLEELLRANQALYDDITKQLGKTSSTSHLKNDQVTTGKGGIQNASIPYLINRFSSMQPGEGSSNSFTPFDSENSGIEGVMQCEGSLRNSGGASTSGSNLIDSFGSRAPKH